MTSLISLAFPCTVCGHEISGKYEEEDFDYPVFCPKCGRQNRLPAVTAAEPVREISSPILDPLAAVSAPAQVPAAVPIVAPTTADPIVPPQPVEVPAQSSDFPVSSFPLRRESSLLADVPAVSSDFPVATHDAPRPTAIPVAETVPQQVVLASPEKPVTAAPPQPPIAKPPAVEPPAVVSSLATAVTRPAPPPQIRGRMAWRFRPASSMRPVVALRNCVAVDPKGRLIAALGPDLYALTPGDSGCEVDWKFTTGEHIPGSPVIGQDGAVFAHSSDGFLHLIDANGVPARPPTRVGPALGWATPLVDESHRAWICAATGGLVRVDATGQTAARPFFRHPSRFDSTGALRGNVLYVGSEDQFLHAIDLQGERGRDRWDPAAKIGLTGWYINSAIALTEESQIVAVSRDDQLYSFDENGGLVWSVPLNGRAIGSPVIAQNGLIAIGLTTRSDTSDLLSGRLVGVHAKTGQLAWKIEFDAPIESTPVVGDGGEIYVGDNLGKVHAVSSQGQRVWSENVGSAVRSAGTIPGAGQVVFGLDDGSLIALNCSSQSLGGAWPKLLATVANRCPSVEP